MSVPPNEPAAPAEGWPGRPGEPRPAPDTAGGPPPASGPPVTSPPSLSSPPPPPGYPAGGYAPGEYPGAGAPTVHLPAAGAPPARRSRAVPVLATLMVLFLLAALGLAGLFLADKNSSDKKIAAQKAKIESLQGNVKTVGDDLAKTRQERDAAKAKADSSAACIKAVQDFFNAVNANDEVAGGKAALVIDRDCEGVDLK